MKLSFNHHNLSTLKRVALVGAGPGNIDYLTIRAFRAIKNADVILYDELISDDIIGLCKPESTLVNVGKRCGDKIDQVYRQDYINLLIRESFIAGKYVVRLKGGNPMIFGRGAEEIMFLIEEDIDFEVIPGLTSGFTGAALLNIPVTMRGLSSDVIITSGHNLHTNRKESIRRYAEMIDTGTPIIIYMGTKVLKEILNSLTEAGVSPSTHVNILSNIARENQQIIHFQMNELVDYEAKTIDLPAVIILGKYVQPLVMKEAVA